MMIKNKNISEYLLLILSSMILLSQFVQLKDPETGIGYISMQCFQSDNFALKHKIPI